jgi:acetyltransferase-like isoleucine patch superfamily enzyme
MKNWYRKFTFAKQIIYPNQEGLLLLGPSTRVSVARTARVIVEGGVVRLGCSLPGSFGFASYGGNVFEVQEGASVTFEGDCWIGPGMSFKVKAGAHLIIGKNVSIAHNLLLYCSHKMRIGHEVGMSWNCQLIDDDRHPYFLSDGTQIERDQRPLVLADYSTLHSHVIIPKGIRVGRNSIIGAGTVLRQDVPDECLVYPKNELKIKPNTVFNRITPAPESALRADS